MARGGSSDVGVWVTRFLGGFTKGESALASLARYGFSGGCVYAADIAAFTFLHWGAGIGPQTSNLVAKIGAAALGFLLHRRFTFSAQDTDNIGGQVARYSGLLVFNIVLSAALVFLFIAALEFPVLPFRILADVVVIVCSYLGMRFFVFRTAPANRQPNSR